MSKKMYIEVQNLPWKRLKYMAQDGSGNWFYYSNKPRDPYNGVWSVTKGDCGYAGRSKLRAGWDKYYYEIIR